MNKHPEIHTKCEVEGNLIWFRTQIPVETKMLEDHLVGFWRMLQRSRIRYVCLLSPFSHVQLFVTLWTTAYSLLCPWDSPGKNTVVCCYALLQGIFNPGIEPVSFIFCIADGFFTTEPLGKPRIRYRAWQINLSCLFLTLILQNFFF